MDWNMIFGGGIFTLTLVGMISGFVYLIMRLITNPLKEDLDELTTSVNDIKEKMKSPEDLDNLIQTHIIKHERTCPCRKGK